jgi:DNA repair protein SbcC/Rad50
MQIQRVKLVNFRQHEDTELVLGAGLTGIIGPNGAGKTTILEAVAWAIYGMPAARGSRESIRRRRAPARSPVRVELDFSLGAHQYRVVRGLNNAELFQDLETAPIAVSLGTVTEKLTRMLGMTREEFFNTYFTGQKELAVMSAMTPMERAKFLSQVLGYEKLRAAQEILRDRKSQLRGRLDALESTLQDTQEMEADENAAKARINNTRDQATKAGERLQAASQQVDALKPKLEAMQRLKQLVAELHGDLKLADHKVSEARERHGQLDRQLVEAIAARDKVRPLLEKLKPMPALKAEAEKLEAMERAVMARKGYEDQLADLRGRFKVAQQKLAKTPDPAELKKEEKELEKAQKALARLQGEVEEMRTVWVRDLQDAKTKRQGLVDQYQEFKEQRDRIVKLGPDGACPTCTRPLGKEFTNVLGVLERQLELVTENGTFYKKRIDQLSKVPAELTKGEKARDKADKDIQVRSEKLGQSRAVAEEAAGLRKESDQLKKKIAELEASLAASAVPYDQGRHTEVRRLLNALESTALEAARLTGLAERAGGLVKEAEAAERSLSEREENARLLKEKMEDLGYREWDFTALLSDVEIAEKARREAEVNATRLKAELAAAEEGLAAVAKRREERARREKEARAVSVDLALNAEVDRAFAALRTELNATLRPDLSDSASGLLRDLSGGRYSELELDEDYAATIVDDGEPKPVISGGEEDLVNLALRLAISQMIAERAGQPLSMLVLDEIFGSLDEDRRLSVLELLRGLADRFPQVILITHVESVREGFDRVIRISYDLNRGTAVALEDSGGLDGLAA